MWSERWLDGEWRTRTLVETPSIPGDRDDNVSGCACGSASVRLRQVSRSTKVNVSVTGPRMSPDGPNTIRPPTTEMKARTVCIFNRFPTRIGYSRLSIPATTPPPHKVRIRALPQLHSKARKRAAGIHTTNAPKTGTTARRPITTPQSNGTGRPSHQNISPPSRPCTAETANVP